MVNFIIKKSQCCVHFWNFKMLTTIVFILVDFDGRRATIHQGFVQSSP